jgi:hypothetical protein
MRARSTTWIVLILAWTALAVVVPLVGCGGSGRPNTVTVTGQVLLDGQPLPGTAVMFTGPEGGAPVTAVTDANGNFKLDAVIGLNKVAVAKTEGGGGAGEAELAPAEEATTPPPVRSVLPAKYANPATSGISVEVKPGMGPVRIELKSQE